MVRKTCSILILNEAAFRDANRGCRLGFVFINTVITQAGHCVALSASGGTAELFGVRRRVLARRAERRRTPIQSQYWSKNQPETSLIAGS
jgi:hypothetical protein